MGQGASAQEPAAPPPAMEAPSPAPDQVFVQAPAVQPLQGLWLTTAFPVLTRPLADRVLIDLLVENRNLPPWRVDLAVAGLPDGWTWLFEARTGAVGAVSVGPDRTETLTLAIAPAAGTTPGLYPFTVRGDVGGSPLELPISLTLVPRETPTASFEARLTRLEGSGRSVFRFPLVLRNQSADPHNFSLLATAAPGFGVLFVDALTGSERPGVALPAGGSLSLEAVVTPPRDVGAGQYAIAVSAAGDGPGARVDLQLGITGEPALELAAPDGRLSGEVAAGKAAAVALLVRNRGTAPAGDVTFGAAAPEGWTVTFLPDRLAELAPGADARVTMTVSPPARTVIGDYVLALRAASAGSSAQAEFRATVEASTMWSLAGLGLIGAAVIVLAAAIARFGRR